MDGMMLSPGLPGTTFQLDVPWKPILHMSKVRHKWELILPEFKKTDSETTFRENSKSSRKGTMSLNLKKI